MPGLTSANEDNLMAAIEAEESKTLGTTPTVESKPSGVPAPTPLAADDPEVDLGEEKVKRSQILEWKKNQLLHSDYTKKTQELAQQRKEMEELVRFADYLKANPQKLQKVLAALEDKAETIETQQANITEELSGLDPNDPYAKLLQQKFSALEKMVKPLQDKLTQFERQAQETQQQQLISQTQQMLSKSLDDTFMNMKFNNDRQKQLCRKMVLSYLKDNPRNYVDENDFKATIAEVSKKQYEELQEIIAASQKEYLDSKKATPPPPATGAQGTIMSKKPTFSNIEDLLQSELERESAL